jgi:TRAP-type C4-dicarboxylate transport system permease small subunit
MPEPNYNSRLTHVDWHPSQRTLRDFGFLAFIVFGALAFGGWQGWLGNRAHDTTSLLLAALAVASLFFSLTTPRRNRPLYLLLTVLSYPIAWTLAWTTLLVVFFGVITPTALVLRLVRAVRRRRRAESAWVRVAPVRDKSSYFRQF